MKRSLGGIIDGAPGIRDAAGHRANLNDCPAGTAEKRHKSLAEPHNSKDIGSKDKFYFREFGIDGGDCIIYIHKALVRSLKLIEGANCSLLPALLTK